MMSCEFISEIRKNSHSPILATSATMKSIHQLVATTHFHEEKRTTWPQGASLAYYNPYMLGTFLHLASEVEGGG